MTPADAPAATIHRLPPPKRIVLTDAQREQAQPFIAEIAALADGPFRIALEAMFEEARRRRLDQLVVDRAAEIGTERMRGPDLGVLAEHMDGRDSLGGLA